MRMRTGILTLIGLVIFGQLFWGCAATRVRFKFTSPPSETIPLVSVQAPNKVLELVDRLNDYCPTGDTLVMIVQEGKAKKAYKLCCSTGESVYLSEITDKAKDHYWDTCEETGMGAGEACMGACMASTPCGGTTAKYGFVAEKNLACSDQTRVMASYQYLERQATSSYGEYSQTETSWQQGLTMKFRQGEEIVEIKDWFGYTFVFNMEGNVHRGRFYPLTETSVLSAVPDFMKKANPYTNVFVYDLEKQQAWGAELDLVKPSTYVDFGLTPDLSKAVLITVVKGKYSIVRMDPKELSLAVKSFRTVQ